MKFPQPPGRTGVRAKSFPALGSERQARLAFVYASSVVRDLASRIPLRCPDPAGWDARHVEMALFMLGSPTQQRKNVFSPRATDEIVASIDRRLAELDLEQKMLEAARSALVE
jgi:hypothetical protein